MRSQTEGGTYSVQTVDAWTNEDLNLVPDPANFTIWRAVQHAIALDLDPSDFVNQILEKYLGAEEKAEEEEGVEAILNELHFILRRQSSLYEKLRLTMDSSSKIPDSVVNVSRFLNELLELQGMRYVIPANLRAFAMAPSATGDDQWAEGDIAPHAGRLWLIFAGLLSDEINELDCAKLALCAELFTGEQVSPLDIHAIAQGEISLDDLTLGRSDKKDGCSKK